MNVSTCVFDHTDSCGVEARQNRGLVLCNISIYFAITLLLEQFLSQNEVEVNQVL